MVNLNFNNHYKVVHITNEMGKYVIGGAGTYMDEIYKHRNGDMGFVMVNTGFYEEDLHINKLPGTTDIIAITKEEIWKLYTLKCDILVIHFFDMAPLLADVITDGKKIVYVAHSVPTVEPCDYDFPFGNDIDTHTKFEFMCQKADNIICVSETEKNKLIRIFPECKDKTTFVNNGISLDDIDNYTLSKNYMNSRKILGYIGRSDYRKGILEIIKAVKNMDVVLYIACPKNHLSYVKRIISYIRCADLEDRVILCGWCGGERKEAFFNKIDALVIPSYYEPFGYVALEGMKRGIPLISSYNGGLGEILEGHRYTYNPYIEGDFEKAYNKFATDTEETIAFTQQFLRNRLFDYSAEKMCNTYINLWQTMY